jgi:hypothetical protein
MLELIRQYAAECLRDVHDEDEIRRRHAKWCLALATGADVALRGPDRRDRLRCLDAESANIRVALAWALGGPGEVLGGELAIVMAPYWYARAQGREGLFWVDRALASRAAASERPRLLHAQAILRHVCDDFEGARQSAKAAVDLFRAAGDARGLASALIAVATTDCMLEDWESARQHADRRPRPRTASVILTSKRKR